MSETTHTSSSCALPHNSNLSSFQHPTRAELTEKVAGVESAVAKEATASSKMASTPSILDRSDSQKRPQEIDRQHADNVTMASTSVSPATQQRRARELATVLLSHATCQGCLRPLQDPVSLPCGHSACLQCIKDRVMPANSPHSDAAVCLPCSTHLPPRLPLTPMTVPCPVHGCPRSAIGRGIGAWAGHLPRYGFNTTAAEHLPLGSQDVGPGSLPLDGFVIGVSEHPQQLTVVPPQHRSKAHLFAVPMPGTSLEPSEGSLPSLSNINLLRIDVTLAKALAVLQKYVASQPKSLRQRKSSPLSARAHRRGRSRALVRLRARARDTTRNGESSTMTSPYLSRLHARTAAQTRSRLATSQPGNGNFGMNDSDLESGTVGGVSAVLSESDDERSSLEDDPDSEDGALNSYHRSRTSWMSDVDSPLEDDEAEEEDARMWPDQVGGAFSRPLNGPHLSTQFSRRNKARPKRRRSKPFDNADSAQQISPRSADAKVAKREPIKVLSHAESGWSTEGSVVDSSSGRLQGSGVLPAEPSARHDGSQTGVGVSTDGVLLPDKLSHHGEPVTQSVATLHKELIEVLECHLCYLLLYQPLTTPCGHTFCKSCFARSLDHGNKCPLCRSELPSFSFFQDHSPNQALLSILSSDTATFSDEDQDSKATQAWLEAPTPRVVKQESAADDPDIHPHHFGMKRLYDQRKAAIEQEEREARLSTPIFVCTLAFPGMPTILHIFEPRYRLMMRRCVESGNPRFGMIMPSRTNGGLEEYGTMLEIKSMQMLADGRSMIETVGSHRFKLLEKGSLDGYTVGRIERVDDIPLEEEMALEQAALRRRKHLERTDSKGSKDTPTQQSVDATAEVPHPASQPSSQSRAAAVATTGESTQEANDHLSLFRAASETEAVGTVSAPPTQPSATADEDGSLAPFPPVPAEPSMQELVEICTTFIETLRSGSAPWLLSRLNHTYGPMPSATEVERLGYWMALVMPIDDHEKAKLLPIRSRRQRLRLVVHWIEQLRQSWWFNSGCTVS